MAVEIRYPTVAHRRLVDEVLSRLRVRSEVAGVLLGGSLARETARDDSDVDILVVTTTLPDDGPFDDVPDDFPGSLPVDLLVRTAEQGRQHFTPDVHRRGDPVEVGWAAAVMTNELLRTAWAVNDLPNPSLDLGTVQRHLDDLTTPPDVADRLRILPRSSPHEALRAQLDLLDLFEPHLSASHPTATVDHRGRGGRR